MIDIKELLSKPFVPGELFHKQLLDDLVKYDPYPSDKMRIQRIHRMCVRHRHIKWADAIEAKYPKCFPKSDMVMAVQMAMMAQKELNVKKQ